MSCSRRLRSDAGEVCDLPFFILFFYSAFGYVCVQNDSIYQQLFKAIETQSQKLAELKKSEISFSVFVLKPIYDTGINPCCKTLNISGTKFGIA